MEISRTVQEGYARDIGRGVIRMDYDTINSMHASVADIVEIRGSRSTLGKIQALYPVDEGKNIVRLDECMRQNAGVDNEDTVTIHLHEYAGISSMVVEYRMIPEAAPINVQYIKDVMEDVPVSQDDHILVPYFVHKYEFNVIKVFPETGGLITKRTEIKFNNT